MRSQSTETSGPPALKSLAAARIAVREGGRVGGDEAAVDEEPDLGSRPTRSGSGAAEPSSAPGSGVSVWPPP